MQSEPPEARPETPDATAPAAERRLHPLTLLFSALPVARSLLLPALVALFSARRAEGGLPVVLLLVFAVVPLALAAARYATFRFGLTPDELVIRSGVMERQHRVVPLGRVQNVDLVRNALHRLFGVAEVRVETAGAGADAEAVLSVLRTGDAEALRRAVLEGLARARGTAPIEGEADSGAASHVEPEPLVRLGPRDLALAGATSNEVGLILAGVAALAGQAGELVNEETLARIAPEWIERLLAGPLPGQAMGEVALAATAGLVALLAVGWGLSIVGSLVRYHGYVLRRQGDQLHQRWGLLTVREATVPLGRVQSVRIVESALRRRLGLASVRIETAGGTPAAGQPARAEAFIPFARRDDVPRLVGAVLDGVDLAALSIRPVHPRSRRRTFYRLAVPVVLGAAMATALGGPRWLALLALLGPAWLAAAAAYRNRGWATIPGHVVARGGVLSRVTWIVPEARLQTLHLTADPFQRRHGLATLVLDTAGNAAAVPDLGRARADALLDALAERMHRRKSEGLDARAGAR